MVSWIQPFEIEIPGGMELVIVLLLVIRLFGASESLKLARSTEQAMGEFRRGREEIEDDLESVEADRVGT